MSAFIVDQIDDAYELIFLSDGNLNRDGPGTEALDDGFDGVIEIRAHPVHLVDEANARNAVLVGLAPHGFRLRLHAGTASNTATAPSSTRSLRSTSAVKSTWPGVSMILMRMSRHSQVVAAEVIVIPRSCSCSIQSMVAVPS